MCHRTGQIVREADLYCSIYSILKELCTVCFAGNFLYFVAPTKYLVLTARLLCGKSAVLKQRKSI